MIGAELTKRDVSKIQINLMIYFVCCGINSIADILPSSMFLLIYVLSIEVLR